MSGNSSYGPTGCEVALNFDTCIQNAGGSLDPKGWTACSVLQGDNSKYNECVYNGYKSIVTCFQSFCNNDTTNTVSTMKAALDQYSSYVQGASNAANQAANQAAGAATQAANQAANVATQAANQAAGAATQAANAATQAAGAAATQAANAAGAATNTVSNADDANDGAISNKVSKILVSFLVVSGLLMNFL